MNAATVCAASGLRMDWHGIDWAHCHRQVRRLQARIVKAVQESRWGKVKALQWLLTHSFSAQGLAVKRVTENQGKRTPGVDGETWSTPRAKSQAVASLGRRGYCPRPLRRVYIPKSNGKQRPLGIPVMKDRAMQALHLQALEPIAETQADRNSYGFRPERSTADAREQCFTLLAQETAPQWVLEGDIQGCFDHISHTWIIDHIPTDKKMVRGWLKAGYWHRHRLFPTEEGTPQGGIISPTLANRVLDGLEKALQERFSRTLHRHRGKNPGIHLVRYADDFIVTGFSRQKLEEEVKPLIEEFLAERGLRLSPEKTKITSIREGFDFLGWNLRKYQGTLLIKPSKKNVRAFLGTIRDTIQAHPQAKQENLIGKLNPKIRGWANYHKSSVAKETFAKVDHGIWQSLWRWSRRRHPNQSRPWIKERYFMREGHRQWVFSARFKTPEGMPRQITLVNASDTPIRRHIKIKGEANPFDPDQEAYFEDRLGQKMKASLMGKAKLLKLWWRQDKACPQCRQKITRETGWNLNHVIPKSEGGKDNMSNLVLMHPNCHRQIHSQKLDVVQPAPVTRGFVEA